MMRIPLISALRSNALFRNAMTLTSGTAIAQAILLLATPLLTRLYNPEAYGLLGVFVSTAGIVAVFATLRFDQAIVLESEPKSADQVFALCIVSSICLAILAFALALPLYLVLPESYKAARVLDFWPLIPVVAMSIGFRNAANMRLIRSKRFRLIASSDIVQTGSSVAIQLLAGLAGAGAAGLIAGNVAGLIAAIILVYGILLRNGLLSELKWPDMGKLWMMAKRHHRFPLFNAPTVLLDRVSQQLPVILFATIHSPVEAGFFWLAYRLLLNPIRLLTHRSRKAYYLRASEFSEQGKSQEPLFVKVTLLLGIVLIVPMAILAFLGPDLFEFVFGAGWRRAGEYVRWLSLIPIFMMLKIPSLELAPIYNRQKEVLLWEILHTISCVAALVIGSVIGDDVTAIALFALAAAVSNSILVAYFWRLASRNEPVFSCAEDTDLTVADSA